MRVGCGVLSQDSGSRRWRKGASIRTAPRRSGELWRPRRRDVLRARARRPWPSGGPRRRRRRSSSAWTPSTTSAAGRRRARRRRRRSHTAWRTPPRPPRAEAASSARRPLHEPKPREPEVEEVQSEEGGRVPTTTTGRTTTGPTACWMAGPKRHAHGADGAHSCRGRAENEISSAGLYWTSTTRGTRTRASGGTPRRAGAAPAYICALCKLVHCPRCGGTGARATPTWRWPSTARHRKRRGPVYDSLYPTWARERFELRVNRKTAVLRCRVLDAPPARGEPPRPVGTCSLPLQDLGERLKKRKAPTRAPSAVKTCVEIKQ